MSGRQRIQREPSSGATAANSSGGQRRSGRDPAQIYAGPGKTFKVKYIGNKDIGDYRGNSMVADSMSQLRKATTKLSKVSVTIRFMGLIVLDEKTKREILNVPVERIKFVCHDKHDVSIFSAVIQLPDSESSLNHRIYCFKTDNKTSITFVRSTNEMFQMFLRIMRSRQMEMNSQRRALEGGGDGRNSSLGATKNVASSNNDNDEEEDDDDAPVTLGFGIPPPPPSYKAAMSKKNAGTYLIPSEIGTKPAPLAPPPSRKSEAGKPIPRPRMSHSSAPPTSEIRPRSHNLAADLPDYSTITEDPAQQQRQRQQQQRQQQQQQQPHDVMVRHDQQLDSMQQISQQQQHQIMTLQQQQQILTRQLSEQLPLQSQESQTARNMQLPPIPVQNEFIAEFPPMPVQNKPPSIPVSSVEASSIYDEIHSPTNLSEIHDAMNLSVQSPQENIYDVPSGMSAPESVESEQARKQAVWNEWEALEGELDTLAKELGMDNVSGDSFYMGRQRAQERNRNEVEGAIATPFDINSSLNNTLSEDPFTDNIFGASFGPPSGSFTASRPQNNLAQPHQDNSADQSADSGAFFDSFADSNSWASFGNMVGMPLGEGHTFASIQSPWNDEAFSLPPLDFSGIQSEGTLPPLDLSAIRLEPLPSSQLASSMGLEFDANFDFLQPPVTSTVTDATNSHWGSEQTAFSPTNTLNGIPVSESQQVSVDTTNTSGQLGPSLDTTSTSGAGLDTWDRSVQPVEGFEADWNSLAMEPCPNGLPPTSIQTSEIGESDFASAWPGDKLTVETSAFFGDGFGSSDVGDWSVTQPSQTQPSADVNLMRQADSMPSVPVSVTSSAIIPSLPILQDSWVNSIAPTSLVQSNTGPVLSTNAKNNSSSLQVNTDNLFSMSDLGDNIGTSTTEVKNGSAVTTGGSGKDWGVTTSPSTDVPANRTSAAPNSSNNNSWESSFSQGESIIPLTQPSSVFSPSAQSQTPGGNHGNSWPLQQQSTPVMASQTGFETWEASLLTKNEPSQNQSTPVTSSQTGLKVSGQADFGLSTDWGVSPLMKSESLQQSSSQANNGSSFETNASSSPNSRSKLEPLAKTKTSHPLPVLLPPPKSSLKRRGKSRPSPNPANIHSNTRSDVNYQPVANDRDQNQSSFSADFSGLSVGNNTTAEFSNPLYQSDIATTTSFLGLQSQHMPTEAAQSFPQQQQQQQQQQQWLPSTSQLQFPSQGQFSQFSTQKPFGVQGPSQQLPLDTQGATQQLPGVQGPSQQQLFGIQGPSQQLPLGVQGSSQQLPQGSSQQQLFGVQRSSQQQLFGVQGSSQQQLFGVQGSSQQQLFGVQGSLQQLPQGSSQQQLFGVQGQQQYGGPEQGYYMQNEFHTQHLPPNAQHGGQGGAVYPTQMSANFNSSPQTPTPTLPLSANAFADLLPLALSPDKSKLKFKEDDLTIKSLTETRNEAKKFAKVTVPTLNDLKTIKEGPKLKPPSGDDFISFDEES